MKAVVFLFMKKRAVRVPIDNAKTVVIHAFGGRKSTEIKASYYNKWVYACTKVPEDCWQRAQKVTQKKDPKSGAMVTRVVEPPPVLIAEMHTMQLVNAIKWCARLASIELNRNPLHMLGKSKADLLTPVPQWRNLLAEAKKRKLKMLGDEGNWADWYREAMGSIAIASLTS